MKRVWLSLGVIMLALVALDGQQPATNVRINAPAIDTAGPVVTITAPTSSTTYDNGTTATVALAGTASDLRTVSSCSYTNSLGGSGSATGTTSWSINSVALTVGSNVITVTCIDDIGNSSNDVLTVTRSSSGGTCDATISAGTNLSTAIQARSGGQTLCLNAGTYSTGTTLTGFTKSPPVIVRPVTTSTAVTISNLAFNGTVGGITFDAYQNGTGTWFTMNAITFDSGGTKSDLLVRGVNASSTTGQFLTVNGRVTGTSGIDRFTNNNVSCSAGGGTDNRMILDANGAAHTFTISNGTIDDGSSDGIRFGGSAGGIVDGVYFANIEENTHTSCHTDSIQVYGGQNITVRDSYFFANNVGFAIYDGSANVNVINNIFDNGLGETQRPWPLELYSVTTALVEHNTLAHRTSCGSDGCALIDVTYKSVDDPSAGVVIRNNIASGIDSSINGNSSQYTSTFNLLRSGASGSNVSGAPTYVGGTNPTTVAGFALTGGSLGKNAASDGADIGADVSTVLALLSRPNGDVPLLARLVQFGFVIPDPLPKRLSPMYAAWQARVALKYGEVAKARAWMETARLSMMARGI